MSDWLARLATDRGVTCATRGGDVLFFASTAVVTDVGPFVLPHVRVRCRSLRSNNRCRVEATRAVSSPFVPVC
jgi:hypothetical protein